MNFHKRVLIGVLIQFIDINLNGFDIIPDFIGYLIIAFAFSKLIIPYAAIGMYCAVILAFASFIEIFQPTTQTMYLYEPGSLLIQSVMIVMGLFQIFYLACIFYVSKEILNDEKSWFPKLFIGLHILSQLFMSIAIHFNYNQVEDFIFPGVGIYLFFYIGFIVFLWRRKNWEQALQQNSEPTASEPVL